MVADQQKTVSQVGSDDSRRVRFRGVELYGHWLSLWPNWSICETSRQGQHSPLDPFPHVEKQRCPALYFYLNSTKNEADGQLQDGQPWPAHQFLTLLRHYLLQEECWMPRNDPDHSTCFQVESFKKVCCFHRNASLKAKLPCMLNLHIWYLSECWIMHASFCIIDVVLGCPPPIP